MVTWLLRQLANDARELGRANAKGRATSPSFWVRQVTSDGYSALVLHRLRERVRRHRIPAVNHLLRRMTTVLYGMEIGNEVTLGDGVSFVHTLGVVLGGDARLGARVRIMGNVTVGTAKDNGYPTIEDDVVIGAGARVLGPIRVGRGAVIGANAVVIRDVPPGAVVTGIPGVARVPSSPPFSSTAKNEDVPPPARKAATQPR